MSMNFKLGKLNFTQPFVQGPLAGYSHSAFRRLLWQNSKLAYACTEMLPASCVVREVHDQTNRFTHRHISERILCYQISGCDPVILSEAASILENIGADIIDLNAGCPKKKIRKKGCGSAMLDNLPNLINCLISIRLKVNCPLTVKVRLPDATSVIKTQSLIQMLNDAGVDGIILHARAWNSDLQPVLKEHFLAATSVSRCPIIINGDIKSLKEGRDLIKETNASACMIARAGFISPWIYQEINPSQDEVYSFIYQHLSAMREFMPEKSVLLQSRTILKYYCKGFNKNISKNIAKASLKSITISQLLSSVREAICDSTQPQLLQVSDLFDQ